MAFEYNRSKGTFIDTESGLIVALRGRVESSDVSFGFRDPSSKATRYGLSDPWFYFGVDFILKKYFFSRPAAKRKTIGGRIAKLKQTLWYYHRGDDQKYLAAKQHIERSVATYLSTYGVPNPRIEVD